MVNEELREQRTVDRFLCLCPYLSIYSLSNLSYILVAALVKPACPSNVYRLVYLSKLAVKSRSHVGVCATSARRVVRARKRRPARSCCSPRRRWPLPRYPRRRRVLEVPSSPRSPQDQRPYQILPHCHASRQTDRGSLKVAHSRDESRLPPVANARARDRASVYRQDIEQVTRWEWTTVNIVLRC